MSWGVHMRQKLIILAILFFGIFISCSIFVREKHIVDKTVKVDNVKYAGVRSSSYGIRPFLSPNGWQHAITAMQNRFEGSTACAIWIVGVMNGERKCRLEFPSDGQQDSNIVFIDYDKHEPYLQYFDSFGIKVFLQVEPANANVNRLIDLVLNRYKHHRCVIGFGIDVEWYCEADSPGWGVKVSDDLAKVWEQQLKSHNPEYQLFLKHWDRNWMPPTYRGDLIFVDDSQMLKNFNGMMDEFVNYWADYFKPNMVFFQIGYRKDRQWWQQLDNPPSDIGTAIAQSISQNCGIFWVDFTLKEVIPINK